MGEGIGTRAGKGPGRQETPCITAGKRYNGEKRCQGMPGGGKGRKTHWERGWGHRATVADRIKG